MRARYACSRMGHLAGTSLRAVVRGMGMIRRVMLRVPVGRSGYCFAMGLGWLSTMHGCGWVAMDWAVMNAAEIKRRRN